MTREELQKQIEELQKQLTEKDALIRQQSVEIEKQSEQIEKQSIQIEKQSIQIENMLQAILHARKERFGAKSEASVYGQLNLFNDEQMDALAEALNHQKEEMGVANKKSSVAKKSGISRDKLAGLPVEVVSYELDPQDVCDQCGSPLKKIGQKIVRSEVEYIKAQVKVKQYVQSVYKCTKCGTDESESGRDHFMVADVPKPLLNHCIVSPSVMTQILYEKYYKGVPLNRQENMWRDLGVIITRKDMCYWTNRICEEWLQPLVEHMHQTMLRENEVIHADETRIQCNHEPGRKAHTDSFMWVMVSGAQEKRQVVLFHYTMTRNGDHAKELLSGWHGILISDAYAGYNKVEDIIRGLCWSHLRRKYIESIPLDKNGKEIAGSKGAEARELIDKIFHKDNELADLTPEIRLEQRQERVQEVLDAFWSWVEETGQLHTTNEKLADALTYSVNQKKNLNTFMTDGRIPLTNNRAELHIRPFATHRRAWLFADTQAGARANATAYSLIETARCYDLNIYEYIKYVLTRVPELDHRNHPERLEELMPWSENLPRECYRKYNPEKDENN